MLVELAPIGASLTHAQAASSAAASSRTPSRMSTILESHDPMFCLSALFAGPVIAPKWSEAHGAIRMRLSHTAFAAIIANVRRVFLECSFESGNARSKVAIRFQNATQLFIQASARFTKPISTDGIMDRARSLQKFL